MQFLLLVMCLLTALPASAACPPLIPAENLWQLTAGVYCLASKIDFEIETLASSVIDGACSCVDASTSVLSTLDELILSDVDSVSSKVDVLLECTLGTQITQAMIPYTINQPGHYYLCDSVSSTGANAITLNANDVYLNLNGFTVSSTNMRAIVTAGGTYSNVTIENGSLSTVAQRAMEVGNITNFTVRNVAFSTTLTSVIFLASITDLVMEDCYVTANGAGGGAHGLEALGINGGRIENVYAYNTTSGSGIRVSTASSSTTLECINCMVDVAGFGFDLQPGAGIVLRDCVASGCARGYQIAGGHLLENCVAHNNGGLGFAIEIATNATLRNCIAKNTTGGAGFWFHASSGIFCEGCISESNNGAGFELSPNDGGSVNCSFDNCVAINNSPNSGFFIGTGNTNSRLTNCIASGNGTGIFEQVGTVGTILVDCRSYHLATAVNPTYNLNTGPDVLQAGTVQVIIS